MRALMHNLIFAFSQFDMVKCHGPIAHEATRRDGAKINRFKMLWSSLKISTSMCEFSFLFFSLFLLPAARLPLCLVDCY